MNAESSAAYTLDSQLRWYSRCIARGVPRHFKEAYLYQRWVYALEAGNTLEAAAIFATLASKSPAQPSLRVPFNFNALSDADCVHRFRFDKSELLMLMELMGLSDIVTRERTAATAIEALCVLLYRLAVPARWHDLSGFFGRSASGLSNIFLHLLNNLDSRYENLAAFSSGIVSERLAVYADAIFVAGAPYPNVWCFIDGTVRGVCRPQPRKVCGKRKYLTQQSVYNGHKRKHALKFQTLLTPDGLIAHLYGPFSGRNHDIKMYSESGLAERIRRDSRFRNYRIFGDCAYGRDDVMLSPFDGAIANLTDAQQLINSKMSKMRVSVEWSYAQILNYWKALDVKSNLRTGAQPVGQMYRVGALLANCITCMRGGNTASDYFRVKPPSIKDYLQSERQYTMIACACSMKCLLPVLMSEGRAEKLRALQNELSVVRVDSLLETKSVLGLLVLERKALFKL